MKTKKLLSLFLVVCLFATLAVQVFANEPIGAIAPTKKRVVSVVYDTSWSMTQALENDEGAKVSPKYEGVKKPSSNNFNYSIDRWLYARYAMQMLMTMLGEEDTLLITSMTPFEENGTEYPTLEIDLSKKDRDTEIHQKLPNPITDEDKQKALNESLFFSSNMQGTPGSSIGAAVNQLTGERGLKPQSELMDADPNLEHWLIIFTDGKFDGVEERINPATGEKIKRDKKEQREETEKEIEQYIASYPSLNVIYLSFGEDGDVIDLASGDLVNKYKFKSHIVNNSDGLSVTMQEIANQLSGRYTIPEDAYEINGNKVSINLNQYAYSFKSVSVIAQDCDATLKSAKYNSSSHPISRPCTIVTPNGLDMKNGASAVLEGDPCFSDGELVFEFSGPVEQVSLLAEPYLSLTHYYEYKDGGEYKRVDMQYINSHLTQEDSIRVGYEAHDGDSGEIIDLTELFGKVVTKVTYAGNSYECGENIPLTVGTNEIGVSVSVLDGKYNLYSSETCVIESNPENYRIESVKFAIEDGANPKLISESIVYVNGEPLDSKLLENGSYKISYTFTAPGEEPKELSPDIKSGGRICLERNIPFGAYGQYSEWIKVTSPEKLSREQTQAVAYVPASITVSAIDNSSLTMTENALSKNDKAIQFALTTAGVPLDFDGGSVKYSLTVNGKPVVGKAEGNILSFTPNASTFEGTGVPILAGDIAVDLEVALVTDESISSTASANITVEPSSYQFEALSSPNKQIDRFALDDTQGVLYFRLLRDNETLSASEIQNLCDAGAITVKDKGTFSSYFWLPVGKEVTTETVNGENVLAVHSTRDWVNPFQTFAAMMILNGEKPVTISGFDTEATDSFLFPASNIWSYIWRILVILLAIHLTLFIIGFFVCKKFPTGTFLKIRLPEDDSMKIGITPLPINISFKDKWLWHYKRLIFMLPIFASQPSETVFGMAEMRFKKKKEKAQLVFTKNMRNLNYNRMNNEAGRAYQDLLKEFRNEKYKGGSPRVKEIINAGVLRKMYKGQDLGAKAASKECNLSETPYGLYNSEQKLKEILLFIRKK